MDEELEKYLVSVCSAVGGFEPAADDGRPCYVLGDEAIGVLQHSAPLVYRENVAFPIGHNHN
jgi:hypothetical protein